MKTDILPHVSPTFVSLLILMLFSVMPAASQDTNRSEAAPTNRMPRSGNSSHSTSTNEFFKTIVESQSGRYVVANATRDTLIAKSKEGAVVWSTNVVTALKAVPLSGEKKITAVKVVDGELIVWVSRGYARVDRNTGAVTWLGSD